MFVNAKEFCLDPCEWIIDDSKFLKIVTGKFVDSYANLSIDFRTINWTDNLNSLDRYLLTAEQQDKILIHGTSLDDQFNLIKNYFGDRVKTIGVNYTENVYETLLRNVSEYHVYRLNQSSFIDAVDSELLKTNNPVNEYMKRFDDMMLIPKSSFIESDFPILIDDFVNKNVVLDYFESLGYPFTNQGSEFYDTWLVKQNF